MNLFAACTSPGANGWQELPALALQMPAGGDAGVLELRDARLDLPGGESLQLAAAYWPANRTLNLSATLDGKALLNLAACKRSDADSSPTVVFLTPAGIHVSLTLGPAA